MDNTKLLEWRNEKGLTLRDAADKLGTDPNRLSQMERGKVAVPKWVGIMIGALDELERVGENVGVDDDGDKLIRNCPFCGAVMEGANLASNPVIRHPEVVAFKTGAVNDRPRSCPLMGRAFNVSPEVWNRRV